MLNQTGSVVKVSKTTNPRWSAPEVIQSSQIGPAADVMLNQTGSVVKVSKTTNPRWSAPEVIQSSQIGPAADVIFSSAQGTNRPDIPEDSKLPGSPGVSLQMYQEVMKRCWSFNPKERPNFKQIVDLFSGMLVMEEKANPAPVRGPKAAKGPAAVPTSAAGSVKSETSSQSPALDADPALAPVKASTMPGEMTGGVGGSLPSEEPIPENAAVAHGLYDSNLESNPFGAAAGAPFDNNAESDPFGAAAGAPFDSNAGSNPFGAAAGAPFDSNAEKNPFGAAAGAPFNSNVESNPFGAAAGAPFDSNAESNPFGAAAGAPFDSNVESDPFGAAAAAPFSSCSDTKEEEYNPFGVAAQAPFDDDAPANPFGAAAAAPFPDSSDRSGVGDSSAAPSTVSFEPTASAVSDRLCSADLQGSVEPLKATLENLESQRANSSPVKMHADGRAYMDLGAPLGEAAVAPFHSFLASSSAQQQQAPPLAFRCSANYPAPQEDFPSRYPVIAPAGTTMWPIASHGPPLTQKSQSTDIELTYGLAAASLASPSGHSAPLDPQPILPALPVEGQIPAAAERLLNKSQSAYTEAQVLAAASPTLEYMRTVSAASGRAGRSALPSFHAADSVSGVPQRSTAGSKLKVPERPIMAFGRPVEAPGSTRAAARPSTAASAGTAKAASPAATPPVRKPSSSSGTAGSKSVIARPAAVPLRPHGSQLSLLTTRPTPGSASLAVTATLSDGLTSPAVASPERPSPEISPRWGLPKAAPSTARSGLSMRTSLTPGSVSSRANSGSSTPGSTQGSRTVSKTAGTSTTPATASTSKTAPTRKSFGAPDGGA
eukprot:gene18695-25216_t